MKKVAAYIRVSTVSQNLDSQKKAIEGWLSGHNLKAEFYEDKSTGDNLDRPAFEQLQRDIFNGKISTVVVFKLDRLSRSLKDGIAVLTNWLEKNVRVVSVTQQLDFSGATGKLIASVLFAVAEIEQETRKERQKAGIEVAKENGMYKGRSKGATSKKNNRARIFELLDSGLKVAEVATALGITRVTVYRAIKERAA